MMSSAAWAHPHQDHQSMTSTSGNDFHQFLDINGMGVLDDAMHFDFHAFQNGSAQAAIIAQPRQTGDAVMGNTDHHQSAAAAMSSTDGHGHGLMPNHAQEQEQQQQQHHRHHHRQQSQPPPPTAISTTAAHPSIPAAHMMASPTQDDAITLIDAQIQYLQQQKFHQQQRQLQEHQAFFSTSGPPMAPTPQSLEMTPGSGSFYSESERLSSRNAYERGYHQRIAEQQDMAFTPLVSPAVTPLTPLDPHFSMESAFVVPNAYFSPLTSPALRAQNDSSSVYDYSTHSNDSPVEMDLESSTYYPTPNLDLSKKPRKMATMPKASRAKPGIKSSPICKPQRKKTGPSPAIVSQVLSEVEENNLRAMDQEPLSLPAASSDVFEENGSVSPENLTNMPPPPIPTRRSTSMSPYIQAQNANARPAVAEASPDDDRMHPATPASLMNLAASSKANKPNPTPTPSPSAGTSRLEPVISEHIESLELPPSIAASPSIAANAAPLPRIESKAAKPGVSSFQALPPPLSSPAIRALGTVSANHSPNSPHPQSTVPGTPNLTRKTPLASTSRQSRKRSSGSIHISPALLPRISPNIKPLLPGGAGMSAEDQASRLLLSKSNYQNILEGNQVPGVSYPSELSTNITSKRTSHKIAEQGRRNRINSALQIMAGLLPESKNNSGNNSNSGIGSSSSSKGASGEDYGDRRDGKQSNNVSNSKASVVENAIVHMQNLEKENVDLKHEVRALRDQLEKLKGGKDLSHDITPR